VSDQENIGGVARRDPLRDAPWQNRAILLAFETAERLFNFLDAGF